MDLVVGNVMLNYFANGYCSTSCSGRGVCDGSANLLPTCDCLTGFTGDQCDECQAGYYGLTCELCPEGGDETKAAPRITDTCGVANSGRSRGTCDDGFVGSGNCTCFEEHFTGDERRACVGSAGASASRKQKFPKRPTTPTPPRRRSSSRRTATRVTNILNPKRR